MEVIMLGFISCDISHSTLATIDTLCGKRLQSPLPHVNATYPTPRNAPKDESIDRKLC